MAIFWGLEKKATGRMFLDGSATVVWYFLCWRFVSSYVKRLDKWYCIDFKIPGIVRCYGRGGMKASRVPENLLNSLLEWKPDIVFIQVGSNDISRYESLCEVVSDINDFVKRVKASGVNKVYVWDFEARDFFEITLIGLFILWKLPKIHKSTPCETFWTLCCTFSCR